MSFSSIIKTIILLLFINVIIALLIYGQAHGSPLTTAPDDSLLKDVQPSELQRIIDSYEGEKAVLVNIWATWCAPCVEEFPHIVDLQRKYRDELKVIFVSADFPDSRDRAVEFLKEQNVDWTTYFKTGKDQPFIEVLSDKWSGALPFTKILSKDGSVVSSWEQGADYEKFERNIKNAIEK